MGYTSPAHTTGEPREIPDIVYLRRNLVNGFVNPSPSHNDPFVSARHVSKLGDWFGDLIAR